MLKVGADVGRRNVKIYDGENFITFPSIVGEYRELRFKDSLSLEDSFIVTINNEKYFVGSLAQRESEFCRQLLVEDKATDDFVVLTLLGLFLTDEVEFDVVTGLPISLHTESNKVALKNLLEGVHDIEVNGVKKKLSINRVRVSVEGGGAFWANPKDGLVRIIDGGSKTINYITVLNKRLVDRDSGTLNFGFDTNVSNDIKQMCTRIAGELGKKWGKYDEVYTVGGNAEILADYLTGYFPNVKPYLLDKKIKNGKDVDLNMFANAIGYYNIGRTL